MIRIIALTLGPTWLQRALAQVAHRHVTVMLQLSSMLPCRHAHLPLRSEKHWLLITNEGAAGLPGSPPGHQQKLLSPYSRIKQLS